MQNGTQGKPLQVFTTFNAIAVVVGIVVGIGIFRLPPLVAQNVANPLQFVLFWLLGGGVSLVGALCYAELASGFPDAGGEYYFLTRAYGPSVGFLFSWGRMTVIQTGSIALAAFILGDYASLVMNLGPYSSSIYAAITVILLTGLNVWGTGPSKGTQDFMTIAIVLILSALVVLSFVAVPESALDTSKESAASNGFGSAGLAMIFVLLTYGGWNEAAYLSAELKDVRKKMVKVLVLGIVLITVLYVLVNLAYLHVLGFETVRSAETIGADVTGRLIGASGELIMALVVIFTALSTANATIITGARTNYALGRDFEFLGFLGKWNKHQNSPIPALLVQGGIALILVGLGAVTKETISTMVEYTAPVFWLFLLLIGVSLFIFRLRNEKEEDAYQVPLYPLTPLLFVATAAVMLYSSLTVTGIGALFGVAILAVGIPVLLWGRRRSGTS